MYDTQRAGMLKRVAAWLLDAILYTSIAAGVLALMGMLLNVESYTKKMDDIYKSYEQRYDISFTMTESDYREMTEEELAAYEAAAEELSKDTEAQKTYEMVLNLTLLMLSVSLLVPYVILEFALPLWLKNGQTIGKKIFNIALMRKDGVKVTPFMLFVRAILGKYTLETMIPVMIVIMMIFGTAGWVGVIALGLILLLQMGILIKTDTNSTIHDLAACTVAVDFGSQMIFDSPEDRLEYIKSIQLDRATNADY